MNWKPRGPTDKVSVVGLLPRGRRSTELNQGGTGEGKKEKNEE